jgi:hypothetical protein
MIYQTFTMFWFNHYYLSLYVLGNAPLVVMNGLKA